MLTEVAQITVGLGVKAQSRKRHPWSLQKPSDVSNVCDFLNRFLYLPVCQHVCFVFKFKFCWLSRLLEFNHCAVLWLTFSLHCVLETPTGSSWVSHLYKSSLSQVIFPNHSAYWLTCPPLCSIWRALHSSDYDLDYITLRLIVLPFILSHIVLVSSVIKNILVWSFGTCAFCDLILTLYINISFFFLSYIWQREI